MAKNSSIFKCDNCGAEYTKEPFGKCRKCGAFGQYSEVSASASGGSSAGLKTSGAARPTKKASTISELNSKPINRIATGIEELDRVLGGGFVDGEVVMLSASPGSGKALKEDTLIPLADGGFKTMGEIEVNDELIDMDGKRTKVLAKFNPVISKAYRLTFSDGTEVEACGDHLWTMYDLKKHRLSSAKQAAYSSFFVEPIDPQKISLLVEALLELKNNEHVTLEEILEILSNYGKTISLKKPAKSIGSTASNNKLSVSYHKYESGVIDHLIKRIEHESKRIGYVEETLSTSELFEQGIHYSYEKRKKWGVPVNTVETYHQQEQSIDAYTLGLWLGDGFSRNPRLGADVNDMLEYISYSPLIKEEKIKLRKTQNNFAMVTLQFKDKSDGYVGHKLRDMNLLNNKHIPENYLYASIEQRQELLRGLMDTDGSIDRNGRAEIGFSNKKLAYDTKQLISSLGMEANVRIKQPTKNGKPFGSLHHRISFTPNFDCFKLSRKLERLTLERRQGNRHKIKYLSDIVEISPEGNYYCIMVDSLSKTFMCTENFVPTHNSTLSMSISDKFASTGKKVLYVSGEESEQQIALRAQRMNISSPLIKIVNETTVETILGHVEDEKPDFLIIDSLQTMASSELTGSMGSIAQSKEAANVFTLLAKKQQIVTILISQVTKGSGNELNFAGSNQIAHIVDCILYLDSDAETPLKFLRAEKNRFGDTVEVGVFQHQEKGLMEVSDPSGILLDNEDSSNLSGTSTSFISEGVRQIPVEIQALVTTSNMPNPRKQFNGVDYNRGQIVCAILDKFCNARLYDNDVFVSTVSGIKVKDPLADLSIAASVISSAKDKKVTVPTAFVGELSLTGQVRGSFMIDNKIREAQRLGFQRIVVPKSAQKNIHVKNLSIQVEYISFVNELTKFLK